MAMTIIIQAGGEMIQGNKTFTRIMKVLMAISVTISAVVIIFVASNLTEVTRMLQVGLVIKTQYLGDVTLKQMLQGATSGMVDSLEDPYSVYMDATQFKDLQSHIQGSMGGIGIYVGEKDKKLLVVSPIEGTPAQRAGILRGDIVIKINDKFTSGMSVDESISMMRGEPGTQVKVGI